MNNKLLGLVLGAMLLTLMALILVVSREPRTAQGSTFPGTEYIATTTDSTWNSKLCVPNLVNAKTLGSVVVALGSNAPLYIYDATTTGPHSDHATTSAALFKTTATAGTYTYDVTLKRGLCVVTGESTVGVASTTITFR